jgi:hypothetical protein
VTQISVPADLAKGIEELEREFPGRVSVEPDEAGAVVHISDVPLGTGWNPNVGVLSFLLPFHYPDAAIYPYHVTDATPDSASDNALQPVTWRGPQRRRSHCATPDGTPPMTPPSGQSC